MDTLKIFSFPIVRASERVKTFCKIKQKQQKSEKIYVILNTYVEPSRLGVVDVEFLHFCASNPIPIPNIFIDRNRKRIGGIELMMSYSLRSIIVNARRFFDFFSFFFSACDCTGVVGEGRRSERRFHAIGKLSEITRILSCDVIECV